MKKYLLQSSFNIVSRTFFAIGLILAVSVHVVTAQSSGVPAANGFRISPVREQIVIDKGQSSVITISVENPSNSLLKAKPVLNNFLAGENESGSPRLVLDENVLPPANDFKTLVQPLEDFEVPPNGSVEIPVIISIPPGANSGGYYGAIRFVPVLPGLEGTENLALTASVGTIVLVTVPGDLTQRLDLVQFGAGQSETVKNFMIGGDVSVITRLKNTGNIHVQPFGKVQLFDFTGELVHEYEFNDIEPRSNILPDSVRRFVDELPEDKKLFGRYTFKANIGFSQGSGEFISTSHVFWYIPTIAFYLIILLLFLMAGAGYWGYHKVFKQKKHKKSHY